MENGQYEIDWESNASHLILSPHMNPTEVQCFTELFQKYHLPAHVWLCSSGSSTAPTESLKLNALSKSAILNSAQSVNSSVQMNSNDVWLRALPSHHIGGLAILARAHLARAKVIDFWRSDLGWNCLEFLKRLVEHKVTLSSLVPTQVFDLVKNNSKAPSTLRAVFVGGGALSAELNRQARALGWPVMPGFGMTETCSQIASVPLVSDLKIDDPEKMQILEHAKVELGENGCLKVGGTSLFSGYAQRQGVNLIWRNPIVKGWYQTSDRGLVSGRELQILGRDQDFVKINGLGVNLAKLRIEFETAMVATAIARPFWELDCREDERSGSQVVLYLISQENLPNIKNVVADWNQQKLPAEKIRNIFLIEKIPRLELQKTDWKRLKSTKILDSVF